MKNILHLCFDGNFLDNTSAVFEHFYPGRNTFCVINRGYTKGRMQEMKDAIWLEGRYPDPSLLEDICKKRQIDTIILHGLNPRYCKALPVLSAGHTRRIFWIFHGFELYYALGEKGLWQGVDNESFFSIESWISPTRYNYFLRKLMGKTLYYDSIVKSLPWIDYFCFWLKEDYDLLLSHFPTNIRFRQFQYKARYRNEEHGTDPIDFDKDSNTIRINHSASKTGNHDTVMRLIAQIDHENVLRKEVPLSYGSPFIRKNVIKMGRKLFGEQFVPLLDYISFDDYLHSLSKVGVALFGHRRQEATGNISLLLKLGAKVFLRESNPLLPFYRRRGYHIFSIESDLKSMDDLRPLTHEQMQHNADTATRNRVYYEDFMPHLLDE